MNNVLKEYSEGFDRAVLDSVIVNRCMNLPLNTENRLKAAVYCLCSRVKYLEEDLLDLQRRAREETNTK